MSVERKIQYTIDELLQYADQMPGGAHRTAFIALLNSMKSAPAKRNHAVVIRRDKHSGEVLTCRLGGCWGKAMDQLVVNYRFTDICRECSDALAESGVEVE